MNAHEAVSHILKKMAEKADVGVSTQEINDVAVTEMGILKVKSFNKGYKPEWAPEPYPAETCISINDEMVHGIPSKERILKNGDIVNLDLGIIDEHGNCGDAGMSVAIGKIDNAKARLLYYTLECLYEAIEIVEAGISNLEISHRIEWFAKRRGFTPIRTFGGHAIGKAMHEAPLIPNTVEPHIENVQLEAGQIICIEPILTKSKDAFGTRDKNGWTVRTSDGKPVAQFEHMILVKENGHEILTNHISRKMNLWH